MGATPHADISEAAYRFAEQLYQNQPPEVLHAQLQQLGDDKSLLRPIRDFGPVFTGFSDRKYPAIHAAIKVALDKWNYTTAIELLDYADRIGFGFSAFDKCKLIDRALRDGKVGDRLEEKRFIKRLIEEGAMDNAAPDSHHASIAHMFAYRLQTSDIPELFLDLMDRGFKAVPTSSEPLLLKCVKKQEWGAVRRILSDHPALACNERFFSMLGDLWAAGPVNDMVSDFSKRVVAPAILLEMGNPDPVPEDILTRAFNVGRYMLMHSHDTEPAKLAFGRLQYGEGTEADIETVVQALQVPAQLSNTWHHATIRRPARLTPLLNNELTWEPLFHGTYTDPVNGYTIKALKSFAELKIESDGNGLEPGEEGYIAGLNHCVGRFSDYAELCAEGKSHILTVADPRGTKTSTVQLTLENGKFKVEQHYGHSNTPMIGSEAHAALKRLVGELERGDGQVRMTENKLGDPNGTFRSIERTIGYELTWDNVQAAFFDFKRPDRRASTVRPSANGAPASLDYIDRGHGRQAVHFIPGASGPGNPRDLPVRSWLYATCGMDAIHSCIQEYYPEVAFQRRDTWDHEYENRTICYDDPPRDLNLLIPGTRLKPGGYLTFDPRRDSHAEARGSYRAQ